MSALTHYPLRNTMSVANMTMNYVPAASHVHNCVAVFCMARSSRPRVLRATFRTCCSTQTNGTKSLRKNVRANGLNFVVDDHGDTGATPVILLHGFPNSANVWERQVYIAFKHAICPAHSLGSITLDKPDLVCRFRLW